MRILGYAVICAGMIVCAAPTAQARDIKVGIIATFSGGLSYFGKQIRRGAELYHKLHKSELKGDTVELIFRDTKNPGGGVAKSVVQELVSRDKVDIIGGSIAPLVTKAKVPVILMNAGSAFLTKISPSFARVSYTMWQAGFIMGEYAAKEMKCKTAITGFSNYAPGKDSSNAFKRGFEDAGGKVVGEIPMGGPGSVPDFTPFLSRVKDKKPDCLYVFVPAGNHTSALMTSYGRLGMKNAGIRFIGPLYLTRETGLKSLGDAAAGFVTAYHYFSDLDTPANKAFIAAWKKEYGADSMPSFVGVGGYDGMAAIYHVLKTVTGRITTEKALAALKGWSFDSPRGKITIDADTRDIVQNIYIKEVVKKDGELVLVPRGTYEGVKDKCKELKIGNCR